MKTAIKFLGIGAAYAACCALPVAGSLFPGSVLAALQSEPMRSIGLAGVVGVGGFLLYRLARAEKARPAPACGRTRAVSSPPIACTLPPGAFKRRLEKIRNLAAESLREARCDGRSLHLIYDASAARHVREMVDRERACCAFLDFDLREDARRIYLTITALEDAGQAADELLRYFAPELAASAQNPPIKKEPVSL